MYFLEKNKTQSIYPMALAIILGWIAMPLWGQSPPAQAFLSVNLSPCLDAQHFKLTFTDGLEKHYVEIRKISPTYATVYTKVVDRSNVTISNIEHGVYLIIYAGIYNTNTPQPIVGEPKIVQTVVPDTTLKVNLGPDLILTENQPTTLDISSQINPQSTRIQWFFNGDKLLQSNPTLNVNQSGEYKVRIEHPHGCSAEDAINIRFVAYKPFYTVRLSDGQYQTLFKIPNANVLNIRIIDVLGHPLDIDPSQMIQTSQTTWRQSAPGIYFVLLDYIDIQTGQTHQITDKVLAY